MFAQAQSFRMVRAASGSTGKENGSQFLIQDPRSTFHIPQDQKVLIYFEWEGPLGQHHIQAVWKNPDGKAVLLSDVTEEAELKRFGAYFGLNLDQNVPAGIWSVEAKIDGQSAGSYDFQVVSDVKTSTESSPQPLTPGEIYKLAVASTMTVEKLDSSGHRFGTAAACFIGKDLLATSFGAVDGADRIRLMLPNGGRTQIAGLVAWNRFLFRRNSSLSFC
jgi:hypothetical protein